MLIRQLNFTQNDLGATSDKNTNFNISKNLLCKVEISNSLCSEQFRSLFLKDKLKQGVHIHQTHDPSSPRVSFSASRERTAARFPANSSHMCCVELALDRLLCTHRSRGFLRRGFSPFITPVHCLQVWSISLQQYLKGKKPFNKSWNFCLLSTFI